MERVFKKVCKAYHLGELRAYEELQSGTDSRVWKLTARGYYLVRTVKSREQAELELMINIHLVKRDFYQMAVVFDTEEGEPALQVDGIWYQVQEFCPGHMPVPGRPGVAAHVARTVSDLSANMPEGLIHGDLGLWNMVAQKDGSLKIVDFGSARKGDPYFDYAAAFAGVINHTSDKTRMSACREFLAALKADRDHLLAQLRLWTEEGVARWGGVSKEMTARFYHALYWAEEHIYEL